MAARLTVCVCLLQALDNCTKDLTKILSPIRSYTKQEWPLTVISRTQVGQRTRSNHCAWKQHRHPRTTRQRRWGFEQPTKHLCTGKKKSRLYWPTFWRMACLTRPNLVIFLLKYLKSPLLETKKHTHAHTHKNTLLQQHHTQPVIAPKQITHTHKRCWVWTSSREN